MAASPVYHIKSIGHYHQLTGLSKPEHPLISVVNLDAIKNVRVEEPMHLVADFYCIAVKWNLNAKFKYGQGAYDFDEGVMSFMSPRQVYGIEARPSGGSMPSGWMILIHPDFLWNTPLAVGIKQYEYFDYAVNEALFLSEKEKKQIIGIIRDIRQEYQLTIDKFSQSIIISQIQTLLNLAERFYHRQFITRKKASHQVLDRLENVLETYFESENLAEKGLPSVQYLAGELTVSAHYLRSLLKSLTGLNVQQHIHEKLIAKAKEKLSNTELTVSEIAYALGFEHSQSFSKLFKAKTNTSPLAFRQAFN